MTQTCVIYAGSPRLFSHDKRWAPLGYEGFYYNEGFLEARMAVT